MRSLRVEDSQSDEDGEICLIGAESPRHEGSDEKPEKKNKTKLRI